jgi:hypothetical protein
MWPNGDFAGPVGSFIEPVPVPGVDPLSGDCSIIRLNKAWLPYVRGALSQLWLQSTWDTDAAGLINVQQQVTNLIFAFNDLEPGDCSPQPQPIGIAESDYEMSICEQLRFNNGILQGYCCGEWVDIQGQASQGNVVPTQPGEGSPVPNPGGGSDEYCGAMGASTWLLPVPVSSGDTLLFSHLGGAWKDSSDPLVWECPNGWNYALGACWERTPRGSPDPLPSGLHMQIIALIDGLYYDVLAIDSDGTPTQFTVPGGISNAQVELQANINDLSRIQGEISFCVDVTNNQLGTWSSTFDFTQTDYSWLTSGATPASYSPGDGWNIGSGLGPFDCNLYINCAACQVTQMIVYQQQFGFTPPASNVARLGAGGSVDVINPAFVNGATVTSYVDAVGITGTTQVDLALGGGGGSGGVLVSKIHLQGIGTKPANFP